MITDLRLQHFRSYNDASFEIGTGVNIIVGPNASGKTNILEAVLVLARGASYRVKDTELIQFGKEWTRVDGHLQDDTQRTVKITTQPSPSKLYELAGRQYKRLSLQHTIPTVLFEPNHLQMLSGGPERRRNYLDDLLEQTTPGFATLRRHYKRALSQRNALLKSHQPEQQIFAWDVRLSQLAGQIVKARIDLVTEIQKQLPALYRKLSKTKTNVGITYITDWPQASYETSMLKALELKRDHDKQRGFTSIGPHREDIVVSFDDHPSQESASRGEARTTILALKIIELNIIEKVREQTPLLLLDDVFSELDGKRRHALTDYLAPYQTFITTTDADLVLQNFTQKTNVIAL